MNNDVNTYLLAFGLKCRNDSIVECCFASASWPVNEECIVERSLLSALLVICMEYGIYDFLLLVVEHCNGLLRSFLQKFMVTLFLRFISRNGNGRQTQVLTGQTW